MLAVINIALMNLLLSSDNVLIISLFGKSVDKNRRFFVLTLSLIASVILQLGVLFVVALLFRISFLHALFGVLICYMAFHLLRNHHKEEEDVHHQSIVSAVSKIVVGNLMMSFENEAALITMSNGNIWIAWIGILTTSPLIFFGSHFIAWLLEKYEIIIYIGSVVLFKIGIDLLFTFTPIQPYATIGSWLLTVIFACYVLYRFVKAKKMLNA